MNPRLLKPLGLAGLAAVVLLALTWHFVAQTSAGPKKQPLVIYCAAALKPPVEAAAHAYEREFKTEVLLQYGASEGLLTNIKIGQKGDLYLPADDSYLESARQAGLLAETIPLVYLRPALAVRKGNPKNIRSLADLQREDVRVALASSAAAIGKLARELLPKCPEWELLRARFEGPQAQVAELGTVTELANSIKVGAVDAGIVWDATVRQYPELEMVAAPLFDATVRKVAAAVLRCSPQPSKTLHFARYLAARDRGLHEFAKRGYQTVEGEPWVDKPELK